MSHPKGTKSPGSGRRRIAETDLDALDVRPELKATHASVIAFSRWLVAGLAEGSIDPRVHAELQKDVEAMRKIAEKREDRRLARERMTAEGSVDRRVRDLEAKMDELVRLATATASGVSTE